MIGWSYPLFPPSSGEVSGFTREDIKEYFVPSGTTDGLKLSLPETLRPVPYSENETFVLLNTLVELNEIPPRFLVMVFSEFIILLLLTSRLSISKAYVSVPLSVDGMYGIYAPGLKP